MKRLKTRRGGVGREKRVPTRARNHTRVSCDLFASLPVVVSVLYAQVLGEAYSTHDEEDMAVKEVTAISISQGRYVWIVYTHDQLRMPGT